MRSGIRTYYDLFHFLTLALAATPVLRNLNLMMPAWAGFLLGVTWRQRRPLSDLDQGATKRPRL